MSRGIGDRIEGIRACLEALVYHLVASILPVEARMGTHRFQKLYKSLTKDETATVGLLKSFEG